MKNLLIAAVIFVATLAGGIANADSLVTQEEMVVATQSALKDYSTIEPDMSKSVSGFKTSISGSDVQVILYMTSDGMNMTAKYLCSKQGPNFNCHFVQ